MVTEAGKELLRNTINTAKFHNKILEENEMWKQWELERGLTMMVSDDVILSRSKSYHQCSKHRKRSSCGRPTELLQRQDRLNRHLNSAGSSKDTLDRWDHNGFRELYPSESDSDHDSPVRRDTEKKWDHSGYLELYPEEAHKVNSSCSTSKEYSKKVKKKKKKHTLNASTACDDNEIWEEFKMFKRSKAATKSRSPDSRSKEWRKKGKA